MNAADGLAEVIWEQIRNRTYRTGDPVPTAAEFCRRYRVSKGTVLKTFRLLSGQGVIHRPPGGRRYRFGQQAVMGRQDSPALQGGPKFEQIARELRDEILAGRYVSMGSLPEPKLLMARFGAHHATVRKALARLSAEGVVGRRGRSYALRAAPRPRGRGRLYLVGQESHINALPAFPHAFIEGAEKELELLGWGSLRSFIADDPLRAHPPEDVDVTGFLYATYGKEAVWSRFLAGKPHVPLVVADFSEQRQPALLRTTPYTLIRPDNDWAGQAVATHLSSLSHRHVAVFSHISLRYDWARLRLMGIRRVFPEEGVSSRRSSRLYLCPVMEPRREGEAPPERSAGPRLTGGRNLNEIFPPMFAGYVERWVDTLGMHEQAERALHDAFEDAFARRQRISAWVCMNDHVALLARRFLRSKTGGEASTVALCGFDNLPHAFLEGITSYDFDFGALGHRAVREIASGEPRHTGEKVIRLRGRLVARESTTAGS